MKLLRENLHDLGFGGNFLDTTPKASSMKEENGKLHLINVESFLLCPSHCE